MSYCFKVSQHLKDKYYPFHVSISQLKVLICGLSLVAKQIIYIFLNLRSAEKQV